MRTRCMEAYIAAAFLVAAGATPTIMVDDGDPGIQYHGAWVHNPVDDPKDFNYGGSVTFTNVSGSTATYKFTGTAIAVFGAFEVAGTFAMHSSYSIDGGPATDFIPAGTIVRAAYRQKFFQSDALSAGEHTLVITNVGRELWFDYLLVTPAPQSTSTAAATSAQAASQKAQAPPLPSTAQATRPETTQSVSGSGPSSQTQTQTTHSISNTNNGTLTSTDAAVPPPAPTGSGSTSQSQTSAFVSGIPSPSGALARAHSAKMSMSAGAIGGLAVAGLLVVVVLAGLVGCRSRSRPKKQASERRDDLTPYDPGLTALAFEPSEKQLQGLARDSDSRGSAATATSLLSLSAPAPAPVYTPAPAETPTRASGSSGEPSVPYMHGIQTTDLDGMRMDRDRRTGTGFEPLGSPSSASPLLARHPRGRQQQKDSPITSSAGPSRYMSTLDERRRSVDGGVRIAGGPPGNLRQGDPDDDVRSGLSTLPPSYQLHPVA